MTENTPHPHPSPGSVVRSLAETVYIVDVVAVALLAGLLVLAGVNPFHSAALTAVLVATVVVMALHHIWFVRHRDEVLHDRATHAMRERRGF